MFVIANQKQKDVQPPPKSQHPYSPSIDTLNRYIRAIKGCYGFQENTFKLLKEKSAKMESSDVRGTLNYII